MKHILESQQTPHISPSQASYGAFIVGICDKADPAVTAPRCTLLSFYIPDTEHMETYMMNNSSANSEKWLCYHNDTIIDHELPAECRPCDTIGLWISKKSMFIVSIL